MNIRIFWVHAMKCMCAQTRPRSIISSERVLGGMEFEPMLTPREKSPLPEDFPRGGSNPRPCGQRAQTLPTSYSGPLQTTHTDEWKQEIRSQGSHLREKNAFFTQKKSRLRKSENAMRLLYAKNSDLTHQNAFSLFVFLHLAEKVCRALAVGLNILDFPRPRPRPPPFPIPSRWRDAGVYVLLMT